MKLSCIFGIVLLSTGGMASAVAQSDSQPVNSPVVTTTVRSVGTGYSPSGPAPAFATLDQNSDASLSNAEASGYKLLANDFIKADSNENGSISVAEYERWAAQP